MSLTMFSSVIAQSTVENIASRIDGSDLTGIVIVSVLATCAVIIVTVTSLTNAFRSARIARIRADLAKDLIDRGVPIADVHVLVRSLSKAARKESCGSSAAAGKPPAVYVPPAKPIVRAGQQT